MHECVNKSITVVRNRLAWTDVTIETNNYMFQCDGVDFNIPLYKDYFFVVHLYEGHLLLLYS